MRSRERLIASVIRFHFDADVHKNIMDIEERDLMRNLGNLPISVITEARMHEK